MAKTLRILTDADFTTKGSTLTFEELDQNFIELHGELRDGTSDLDLNSIDINGISLADSSRNVRGNTLRTDTGKFLSPNSYQFRDAGDTGFRNVEMADLTADAGAFSSTLDVTGKGTFTNELEANGLLDVNANIDLDDSATDISTDTFASGFAGNGLAFLNDGSWDGTLDNLTVRQRLRVYELLINQVRATNGSLVVTSATKTGREDDLGFSPVQQQGGTLDWNSTDPFWTETDQYWYRTYRVYIEENQFVPFDEGALVIAQRFTGDGVYVVEGTVINVENGSSTVTDNVTRRYFDINLTADSDVPTTGMDFVQWGHLTDPDQQGVLYLTADDDDAPYMDIVYGMDSHAKRNSSDTVKGRIGRLDGIVDTDFPTLDGTQTNEFGVYIDGGYFNNVEVRGTITVLDEDASNAATKSYVTRTSSNEVIQSDTEPTTRDDGSALVKGDVWEDTNDDETWMWDGSDFVTPFTLIHGSGIATESITASSIAANTITASELAADSVTATEINVSDLSAVSASIDGTLTMGSSGEITNSNNDYSITANGIQVAETSVSGGEAVRSFNVGNQGRIYGRSDIPVMSIFALSGNNMNIETSNGHLSFNVGGGNNIRFFAGSGEQITIDALPTSDPGVVNALYIETATNTSGDLIDVVCVSGG